MRRFSADYLREARRGMWSDDRAALEPLDLPGRERILDVGCGTGALAGVLREESGARVVGVDADLSLLGAAPPDAADGLVAGDATRLPFCDGSFDLVAAQALLVNLPEPARAVAEFARVSADGVAVVEPDNAGVAVESTVAAESALARRAREAYIQGVETDVALGADARQVLEEAGLDGVTTLLHRHATQVEPPYSERALEAARRKVRATRLEATRQTLLAGDLTPEEYDALAADWQSMGRAVVEQMRDGRYRRAEVVPYYVTVGRT